MRSARRQPNASAGLTPDTGWERKPPRAAPRCRHRRGRKTRPLPAPPGYKACAAGYARTIAHHRCRQRRHENPGHAVVIFSQCESVVHPSAAGQPEMSVTDGTLPVMEPSDDHRATLAEQLARAPVITDADVLARVDEIIDPAARQERALWLFFFYSDGTQAPVIVPLEDMPEMPADDDAEVAFHMLRHFYGLNEDDDLAFVLTLCRDGTLQLTDSDRRWLHVLQRGISEYTTPVRMLCLATPAGVRELGPPF